jgi:uncharacterized lipoprotein YehR (DUF1307 family)
MAEEENKLLNEVRQGIMPQTQNAPPVKKSDLDNTTREEMNKILTELKQKMKDIDRITNELNRKRNELTKSSPIKTEKLLQEIIVPPLEILK